MFKKITDEKNLKSKKVLLRLDLNVPIVNGEVRDDFRIKRILPTLEFLKKEGARTIIMSHLESVETKSLARIATYISQSIKIKALVTDLKDAHAVVGSMEDGDIIMLENLRLDNGEKENNPIFASKLAMLGDIYVNDAFAVSHREHASVVSVPKLMRSFAGPLLVEEVENLSKAFNPNRPFLFAVGGAKFDTKLPLIEKFTNIADYVFVGGALSNDIFKEMGYEVGKSLLSKNKVNLRNIASNSKVIIPKDVVIKSLTKESKNSDSLGEEDIVLDCGPQTIGELEDLLSDTNLVVWNGPLGDYENGYVEGTLAFAKAIIESGAEAIIGGGDSVAVIAKAGLMDKFSFVSTGGGAMLDFLSQGTLPGIEVLKDN